MDSLYWNYHLLVLTKLFSVTFSKLPPATLPCNCSVLCRRGWCHNNNLRFSVQWQAFFSVCDHMHEWWVKLGSFWAQKLSICWWNDACRCYWLVKAVPPGFPAHQLVDCLHMSLFKLWCYILYNTAQVSEAVFRTCQIAALAYFIFPNTRNKAKSENTNICTLTLSAWGKRKLSLNLLSFSFVSHCAPCNVA